MARLMRDGGRFLSGRSLEVPPRIFMGAAANPFVPPLEFRARHLAKKVEAGADFIQTQFVFDVPRMRQFMNEVRDLGLDRRVHILAGVGPLRSAKTAEWMRNHVPGVVVSEEALRRMRGVPLDRQREEGKRLCVEIIREVREMPGIHGVHVMAYRQEELVAEIIEEAGLLPRRAEPAAARSIEERVP